jgi:ribosomal protein S4
MIARRKAAGDGGMEVLHILERRLSDVVYRAMTTDARAATEPATA